MFAAASLEPKFTPAVIAKLIKTHNIPNPQAALPYLVLAHQVACLLRNEIAQQNKHHSNQQSSDIFCSSTVLDRSLEDYILRFMTYAPARGSSFNIIKENIIFALINLKRFLENKINPTWLNPFNVNALFATCLLVVTKQHDDHHYKNAYFAKITGLLLDEVAEDGSHLPDSKMMSKLEASLLSSCNFALFVNLTPQNDSEYVRMHHYLALTSSQQTDLPNLTLCQESQEFQQLVTAQAGAIAHMQKVRIESGQLLEAMIIPSPEKSCSHYLSLIKEVKAEQPRNLTAEIKQGPEEDEDKFHQALSAAMKSKNTKATLELLQAGADPKLVSSKNLTTSERRTAKFFTKWIGEDANFFEPPPMLVYALHYLPECMEELLKKNPDAREAIGYLVQPATGLPNDVKVIKACLLLVEYACRNKMVYRPALLKNFLTDHLPSARIKMLETSEQERTEMNAAVQQFIQFLSLAKNTNPHTLWQSADLTEMPPPQTGGANCVVL